MPVGRIAFLNPNSFDSPRWWTFRPKRLVKRSIAASMSRTTTVSSTTSPSMMRLPHSWARLDRLVCSYCSPRAWGPSLRPALRLARRPRDGLQRAPRADHTVESAGSHASLSRKILLRLTSAGGAPAPRRPAARKILLRLTSAGGAPAPRRPAARKILLRLTSAGGAPAPRRPAARKTLLRMDRCRGGLRHDGHRGHRALGVLAAIPADPRGVQLAARAHRRRLLVRLSRVGHSGPGARRSDRSARPARGDAAGCRDGRRRA